MKIANIPIPTLRNFWDMRKEKKIKTYNPRMRMEKNKEDFKYGCFGELVFVYIAWRPPKIQNRFSARLLAFCFAITFVTFCVLLSWLVYFASVCLACWNFTRILQCWLVEGVVYTIFISVAFFILGQNRGISNKK